MKYPKTPSNKHNHQNNRLVKSLGGAVLLALAMGLATPLAQAQSATGSLSGTVLDSSSGKYLEGAEITVEGLDITIPTERDGSFNILSLPPGTYTLVINYPGRDAVKQQVTVVSGTKATSVEIKLAEAEVIQLDAFSVSTTKEGMAQAQALQKIAIQTKIVAANDQFGEISEGNIGEYLKYLPGIGIDYNANDARGISLRGLRTQFTVVAVDGTPMASAASGGDNRRFELEQIAMNNVEYTEIYKTMSPDIAADSTGGFVNMITKSSFDRKDTQLFTYNLNLTAMSSRVATARRANLWGNGKHYPIRPNMELNYARKINDKLGFNVNYRFSEIYHDSPRSEYSWIYAGKDSAGTAFSLADPSLLTYNQVNEQKMTHRESFATKLDWHISDDTKFTLSAQWNWYDLTFTQRAQTFGFYGASLSSSTTAAVLPLNLAGAESSASSASNRYVRLQNTQRAKYGTTLHGNATLSHEFNNGGKAWVTGYWSKANSKYRDNTKGFVANAIATYTGTQPTFTFNNTLTNPTKPDMVLSVDPALLRDAANYTMAVGTGSDNVRYRPDTAWDTKTGTQAHYKKDLKDLPFPVSIQVGTALDSVERKIQRRNIRVNGITSISGADLNSKYVSSDSFDLGYGYGNIDSLDLYSLANALKGYMTFVSTNDWRYITEDNFAGYARIDIKPTRDLLIYGGVRYEERTIDASAQSKASTRSKLATSNLEYGHYYPSVSAKYTPSKLKSIVVRGGFSRTIGHPDYSDILPNFTGESSTGKGDGTITIADPNIAPYTVSNYDLGVDYYTKKGGVLSAWWFRKEVKGFIVSQSVATSDSRVQEVISENNLSSTEYASATLKTNGKNSSLSGMELQYVQNFKFLPAPFNGLTLTTNYTKINIGADNLDTKYAQLTSAVTQSMNAILGYRWQKWNFMVSTNRTDKVLLSTASQTVGTATAKITSWKAPETKTSIKAEYSISRHYRMYAEIRNIGYTRTEYYSGYNPEDAGVRLPGREFKFGDPTYVLGFKGEF